MPPKSQPAVAAVAKSAPTTPEQMKFVINYLAVENNRLACFGGAGAKASYGGRSVVKPATAYNALAQAVNGKFGTSWDADSAKSRVRNMKNKFHTVYSLCEGKVNEANDHWKLTDADAKEGIHTLADKAQHLCPHWNSWFEWCGNDPNMSKHGSGGSSLNNGHNSDDDDGNGQGEPGGAADGDGKLGGAAGSDGNDGDEGAESEPRTFAQLAVDRAADGDEGNVGEGGEEQGQPPRAVSAKVDAVGGGSDALKLQQQQRKEMLKGMPDEEKKKFHAQEQKEKRRREQEESEGRRRAVGQGQVDAARSPTSAAADAQSKSTSGSPFTPTSGAGNKDWTALFLAERSKQLDAKDDLSANAKVKVAKMQLDAAAEQNAQELVHKREVLSFQQQQAQLQMQFQQQQQQMYCMMKQHEMHMAGVMQVAKSKSDFYISGMAANIPLDQLNATAASMFAPPPVFASFAMPPAPAPSATQPPAGGN